MAAAPGKRIRELRVAREISQSEAARRLKISRQALSAIESGVYRPGVDVALGLAQLLGTTVEALFGEALSANLA